MKNQPVYINTFKNGGLGKVADQLFSSLSSCEICPRRCKVDRLSDKLGFCKTGKLPKVYSFFAHQGEEPPISGTKGSGTIFFTYCNLGCIYCQNYEFSQLGKGREYSFEELADIMLKLQDQGCHNINLVTPTHVLPQILKALEIAIPKGLKIPLVYNTSGYELAQVIKLLEGIIDIYLADIRYSDSMISKELSGAADYVKCNQSAIIEMHRQVGIAKFDDNQIMERGLIIRHLVLPNNCSGTEEAMKFVAGGISDQTYISLMSQYLPYHLAKQNPKINRRLKEEEYELAKEILEKYHLHNGWIQESYGQERFAGVHIKPV